MDPVAHSLFGACLAATRVGRRTPRATLTAVLAANAPDVDALTYLAGGDTALGFRRGWTHGPLGVAILPLCVVVFVLAFDRWRRVPDESRRPVEPARLAAIAHLATLSHPALDWLNTYGIRVLMPFDGRWFYGDTLFIVDPWMWLLLGAGAFLAHLRTRRSLLLWGALAVATSLVIVPAATASTAFGVVWVAAVAAVALLKLRTPAGDGATLARAPSVLLVAFLAYVALMIAGARASRHLVGEELAARDVAPVEKLMVGPVPVTPFEREVVWSTPGQVHYGTFRWLPHPVFEDPGWSRPRRLDEPVVRAALTDPCIAGFAHWARFPFAAEIEPTPDGDVVHLLDARYARTLGARFGEASVLVQATRSH